MARPELLLQLHVVARQQVAVQEDNLILAAEGRLAGIGSLGERHRPDDPRHRPNPRIPDPESQHQPDQTGKGAGYEADPAPGARLPHRLLTGVHRNVDAARLGLGLAERRADVAEEFHALRADRLRTDTAFVDAELAGMFGARLQLVGSRRRSLA